MKVPIGRYLMNHKIKPIILTYSWIRLWTNIFGVVNNIPILYRYL